jgi:peptidoglycan pentaglycine glycine transferase (the first glycine)
MAELNSSEWDAFLNRHPNAHLLQTVPWGELKSAFGWRAVRVCVPLKKGVDSSSSEEDHVGAQILFRQLPIGIRFAYIPKGPVLPDSSNHLHSTLVYPELWQAIDEACIKRKAVFLKVEPDLWEPESDSQTEIPSPPSGFLPSRHAIQPSRTLVVDLKGEEEGILSRMKQKTRYNIKLALKKGVVVHPSSDLPAFYRLMQLTAGRDEFGVHSLEYYSQVYELFYPRGSCELLVAEYQGQSLAALMVFAHGQRAWYFYGASASDHRDRMPTYLLQWEAMRWARSRGCTQYDLWGVPNEESQVLESQFTTRTDGLWRVYRFKRGFGGRLRRSIDPWDRVYRPSLYRLYQWWVDRRMG